MSTAKDKQKCLDCLTQAIADLDGQADQSELTKISNLIIQTMTGPWRSFHTPNHIFEVGEGGDAIEVISALFHDLVYVQVDQGISVNTSYNPQNYEDEKIPMSEMLKHLIMFYKYGGKQLYYFNTFDGSGEIDIESLQTSSPVVHVEQDDADCDSCKI